MTAINFDDPTPAPALNDDVAADDSSFRLLFDACPDPMLVFEIQTLRFLEVNEAAQERYGYSRAEFLRLRLPDVHAPEEIARLSQEIIRAKPGITNVGEWRHRCKNGDPIDVEVRVRDIRFGGAPCRLGTWHDVTERKRAEERLRESEDRYRHAIDQSDAVLYQLDYVSQRYVFISDRIERITGYRPDEITTTLWRQMIRETRMRGEATGLPAADAAVRVHSNELKEWRADYRILTRSGETRWLSDSSIQLHDKNGKVQGALGILQDITDREQAMRALHESEERLRAMTQFSSDIITILEADGTIRSQTGGIKALLGYTEKEMAGQSVFFYVHEDDQDAIRQSMRNLVIGGAPVVTATFRIRHGDGSWRWVESIANSQMQNQAIAGIVVNSRDVTDRVRFQQQIVQSQKLASLGELVAGVAHEINNPLAVISGQAQLLQMHGDAQVREDATAIRDMAQRASRITNSLRSYARPIHDRATSRSQPGDLKQVIQSSLDVIAHKLRSTEVALITEHEQGLPLVPMNVGEIEQVLVNLISNAEYILRTMPEERREIRIKTWWNRQQNLVSLSVADRGCGMSEAVALKVFDPFFTTKDTGEGTGLGLYISYGIIAAHGGTITVKSREEEGTVFTITLPGSA